MPSADNPYLRDVTARMVQAVEAVLDNGSNRVTSQAQFAEEIGTQATQVSRWFNGKGSCTIEDVVRTCSRFRVSPSFVILGVGSIFMDGSVKQSPDQSMQKINLRIASLESRIGKLESKRSSARSK